MWTFKLISGLIFEGTSCIFPPSNQIIWGWCKALGVVTAMDNEMSALTWWYIKEMRLVGSLLTGCTSLSWFVSICWGLWKIYVCFGYEKTEGWLEAFKSEFAPDTPKHACLLLLYGCTLIANQWDSCFLNTCVLHTFRQHYHKKGICWRIPSANSCLVAAFYVRGWDE